MAKKIRIVLTLQLPAGKATPAPPVGTALGPHGINIVEFTKSYNEKTADKSGQIIPAQITIFEDRSFTFILKTPPAADLLRKAAGIEKGAATTGRETAGRVTRDQLREIADDQDDRPQRQRPRGGRPPDRGHRPIDGHRGRRLAQPTTRDRPRDDRRTSTPRQGEAGSRPPQRGTDTMAHGKKYHDAAKLVDHDTVYAPAEAAELVRQTSTVNFDPTVEAHLRLGVDPAPRRPDGPRHGRPAARHGQGRPGRRVRPGREGPGGPPQRRRRGRRRGPGQEDRGGLDSSSTSPSRRPTRWAWSASSARSSAARA